MRNLVAWYPKRKRVVVLWIIVLSILIAMGLWEMFWLLVYEITGIWHDKTISAQAYHHPEIAKPLAAFFLAAAGAVAFHLIEEGEWGKKGQ